MYHKNEIIRMHRELVEQKETLTKELKILPEGELFCSDTNGYRRYYRRLPAVGNRKKERRYGIKSNPTMMSKMVRKAYVEKALKLIDHDIEVLSIAGEKYIPIDENTLMEPLKIRYPETANRIYRNAVDADEWMSSQARIEEYHAEHLNQTAADGTKMRSKNEVYIASRLDYYNLVYRSDCPTGIKGLYRIPDFTILRRKDNKPIYWEHMGMMDDPDYREESKRKIEEYEKVGIVPWDNLIITYDTDKGGLRADIIEMMIQTWLI